MALAGEMDPDGMRISEADRRQAPGASRTGTFRTAAQGSKNFLGFGDDIGHHGGGTLDLMNHRCTLASRESTVIDIAFKAAQHRCRLTDFQQLLRKSTDLIAVFVPMRRESIPDQPRRFPGMATGYGRAFL